MPFADYSPQQEVVLPAHLPAHCFVQTATDYRVPAIVLVAMAKVESNGRSAVGVNKNGSLDLGVMQHNTDSWVPHLTRRYGILPQDLLANPCQSIRAAGYVLRVEQNAKACKGRDIWCGVGRYHSPNDATKSEVYVRKVRAALNDLLTGGKF